jgi:hypothetical protein
MQMPYKVSFLVTQITRCSNGPVEVPKATSVSGACFASAESLE